MVFNDFCSFHKIVFKIKFSFAFGNALGNVSVNLLFASSFKAYTICTFVAF